MTPDKIPKPRKIGSDFRPGRPKTSGIGTRICQADGASMKYRAFSGPGSFAPNSLFFSGRVMLMSRHKSAIVEELPSDRLALT